MNAKDTAKTSVDLQAALNEYRKQLAKGTIKTAYKGLMGYLDGLRLHFEKTYPDFNVSGSVQQGLMDYSYFYFFPKALKDQKLKIVVLFVHDTFRFEVWLAAYNKNVQAKIWKQLKEANFTTYKLPSNLDGVDSIVEQVLVENADFCNPDALTKKIEDGSMKFIADIEGFLSKL